MKIYKGVSLDIKIQPCVLALGTFDGVHKGHVRLLNAAKKYSLEHGLLFGVYTFEKHPAGNVGLLTLNAEKCARFELCGADFVIFDDFDSVKNYSPNEFISYITEKIGTVCAVCGENFRFGKGALGSSGDLKRLMQKAGFDACVVTTLYDGGLSVSSTRIRNELENGNAQAASELLGYPFGFEAEIIHGASLGHTIGFPTINQELPKNKLRPKFGVYASCVEVCGKKRKGVTNIGVKPTVSDEKQVLSETYIIDFDENVYGKIARVSLYKMLRGEKKFSGIDELTQNISKNVFETKKYFEGNKR